MPSRPSPLYKLLHKDYCEDLSHYSPQSSDFHNIIAAGIPGDWRISRQGIWLYCCSPESKLPAQGWKIHISATLENAREVLGRVASVLFRHPDASFKFVLDLNILSLLNGKNWRRGGSGKFMTIYPPDNQRFQELIEELHCATRSLHGPYVLSDYRYKDSGIVFYRYGGMQLRRKLNIKGEMVPVLTAPDGTEVPDQRLAYPVMPPWESPLFAAQGTESPPGSDFDLQNGRYTIEGVFLFANSGGVYSARDNSTGKRVVIKEARPYVNATFDGYDAVQLLKKEHCLLRVLSGTGIAPEPLDLFQEWEHWFLVEEHVDGVPLDAYSAAHNVLLRTRPQPADYEQWYQAVRSVAANLATILETLHDHQIVFVDISPANVLVAEGGRNLKIIDFEGAYQVGVHPPTTIYTPGFISQERLSGRTAGFQDDYYSVGAVLLAFLFPVNGFLHLKPEAKSEFLISIGQHARLPQPVIQMVHDLMHPDQAQRPRPDKMKAMLQSTGPSSIPVLTQEPAVDWSTMLDDIVKHIESSATYHRTDRLFPADPKVFLTNPISIGYGAAGVIYALQKITGNVPQRAVDWVLSHARPESCPPGLYVGLAGVAWSLLEIGLVDQAETVFRKTLNHPLLNHSADLFYGLAGWGMAALRLFLATGNEEYLDAARYAGESLIATHKACSTGLWWGTSGKPEIGLAHGSSGIALFLLYLYSITNDLKFLSVGREALNFDLAAGISTKDGGLSWSCSSGISSPVYPYWRYGSAGVGVAAVRFARALGLDEYRESLERIFIDTDRTFAVTPGLYMGLAGLGDFMLDMHQFTGETRFLKSAWKIAGGIMRYRVHRDGIAFPGNSQARLSCDYGTGSAGIGIFLHRLSTGQASHFLLDSLLEAKSQPVQWVDGKTLSAKDYKAAA